MNQDTPQKILVVEDEVPMRKMLVGVLQQAGYVVLEATNGEDGKNQAIERQPDLVVTDNAMPITNGVEMIEQIRASGAWGSKVPIILMTNLNDTAAVNKTLQAGGVDYLMKSDVQLDDIVKLVAERLGQKRNAPSGW